MTKKQFIQRPMNWSQLSSFVWNKEGWYRTYILGEKQVSPEMTFGTKIDKKYQDDKTFLPDLPRYPLLQYKMNTMLGDIPLYGTPDGLDLNKFILADLKTGVNAWDKKRTDEHGQLTMYLLLVYLTKKIPPEKFKCFIHWLPTKKEESGNFEVKISFRDNPVVPITFETSRTMKDLLNFGVFIKKTIMEMWEYVDKRLQ